MLEEKKNFSDNFFIRHRRHRCRLIKLSGSIAPKLSPCAFKLRQTAGDIHNFTINLVYIKYCVGRLVTLSKVSEIRDDEKKKEEN